MPESMYQRYKPPKKINEQIQYLEDNKRVKFNIIDKREAARILLKYNYINVITPFKHKFAKTNDKKEVIKEKGGHIYERDVEFSEYYNEFIKERSKYPIIINNILNFEIHFKSITAYHILTYYNLNDSDDLLQFLDNLIIYLSFKDSYFRNKRNKHVRNNIIDLKNDIFQFADIYCFFDRMSLGNMLDIYTCLDTKIQDKILSDLKKFNMNFNIDKIPDFINKIFCLVSIRNCVMHSNSLEILVRFYNPKTHDLRKSSDRKRYTNLIKTLSKEKTH